MVEGGVKNGGAAHRVLWEQLWLACAGPLVKLPAIGERVYYFPEGHLEQMEILTNKSTRPLWGTYQLPWKIPCRVKNIQLKVDQDTEEVYALFTLLPEKKQDENTFEELQEEEVIPQEPPAANEEPMVYSFSKVLSQSDISIRSKRTNSLVIPGRNAEACFPPLGEDVCEQVLITEDLHGIDWPFRHVFRGSPKRNLLQGVWGNFVTSKRICAGDVFVFLSGENGQMRVGVRRAKKHYDPCLTKVEDTDCHNNVVYLVASHAWNHGREIVINYRPRAGDFDFIAPIDRVDECLKRNYEVGDRFVMKCEQDGTVGSWRGKITGIQDSESKWRSLEVLWDKDNLFSGTRPHRISPWEIEAALSPSLARTLREPEANPIKKRKKREPVAERHCTDVTNLSSDSASGLIDGQANGKPCKLHGSSHPKKSGSSQTPAYESCVDTIFQNGCSSKQKFCQVTRSGARYVTFVDLKGCSCFDDLIARVDEGLLLCGELEGNRSHWVIYFKFDDESILRLNMNASIPLTSADIARLRKLHIASKEEVTKMNLEGPWE